MITRCPSCSTRLNLQEQTHQPGGLVRCPGCGHGWLEGRAVEISAETVRTEAPGAEPLGRSEAEIQQLVSASRLAQEAFQFRRRRRRAVATAWLGLAVAAAGPAAIALAFPERVVAHVPAMIGFYDWLGREVNIYGLKIKGVELRHLMAEGQRVIAIRGEIVNVSETSRKIPWLRFGLRSNEEKEVYHWQLNTESLPLRPGEVKSFITRISSPPLTASAVEIRFARADEIGSNAAP